MQIGAVVVTFNKLGFLKECVEAILNQTKKIDYLFVIDNNSTDGTAEYLKKLSQKNNQIKYYKLSINIGGAGGFNYGLKMAYKEKLDFIWIMDDDTIPHVDALEKLLSHVNESKLDAGFFCSKVNWTDETPCIMNIPTVSSNWLDFVSEKLIGVQSASFVSLLIPKSMLKEVGLPYKEFFIWGDDTEFTSRITRKYRGYLVTDSIVVHKMNKNMTTNILVDDVSRIKRYFYDYRNSVFVAKKSGTKSFVKKILQILSLTNKVLFSNNKNKLKKIKVIIKGTVYGVFFHPQIEQVNEK